MLIELILFNLIFFYMFYSLYSRILSIILCDIPVTIELYKKNINTNITYIILNLSLNILFILAAISILVYIILFFELYLLFIGGFLAFILSFRTKPFKYTSKNIVRYMSLYSHKFNSPEIGNFIRGFYSANDSLYLEDDFKLAVVDAIKWGEANKNGENNSSRK